MHFFTEPNLLNDQTALADAFGPQVGDESNKFEISSKHTVSSKAKIIACQDAMMLVLPHVDNTGSVSTSLVNLVLKPISGLDIKFPPVKYYIYRGVDKNSFISGSAIVPDATPTKTEFIAKLWTNWNSFKTNTNQPGLADPTPQSFGYDPTLTDPAKKVLLLEEFYNSEESTNTFINDFQAIKVDEGEWIADLNPSVDFEFEIIVDTDHLTMDLEYAQLYKQVIDQTSKTGFDKMMEREKVLNYVDPAAFFGMHFYVGTYLASFAGSTKNPSILKQEKPLVDDMLAKFHNEKVVYLDVRSENGYSYNLYESYRNDHFSGSTLQYSSIINVKSASGATFDFVDFLTLDWPLVNLTLSPPFSLSPLVDGDKIDIQLRINDNMKPLLFVENPKLFGSANTDNFKKETDLIDPASLPLTLPGDWTNTMTLEIPFVDNGGTKSNVAHHIQLQYFRQEKSTFSPNSVLTVDSYLDAAFGGIEMPDLVVNTPFNHVQNNKRKFINSPNFAYVARNGVLKEGTQLLFYAEKDFSLQASADVYPRFDASVVPAADIDAILKFKNVVLNKWQINDGTTNIDILGIVGFNRTSLEVTPKEDLLFIGITQTELDDLKGLAGVSDLHHKYFYFTELLDTGNVPFVDTISLTAYKKYRIDVQGIDASTGNAEIISSASLTNPVIVYGMDNYTLCSPGFGAASNAPIQLPDPGTYNEFTHYHIEPYDNRSSMVTDLFAGGVINIEDNKMSWEGPPNLVNEDVGLVGELFYPTDGAGSTTLSASRPNFPLIVICHANGGRYTDYRQLAIHLAQNGFIVCSTSALIYSQNAFDIFRVGDLPSSVPSPPFSFPEYQYYFTLLSLPFANLSDYYVISDGRFLDTMYLYGNDSSNATTYEKVIVIEFSEIEKYPYDTVNFGTDPSERTYIDHTVLGWKKGVDFDIFIDPTAFNWDRKGGRPATGLDQFGLSWLKNVGSGSFSAKITKAGTRLVELTAADWALDSQIDIKNAIDAASDVSDVLIPFPASGISKYLGTIMNGVYYMLKVDDSTSAACPQGTCVNITGEVKNRQLEIKLNLGRHGMRILGRANLVFPHVQIVKHYIEKEFKLGSGTVERIQNQIGLIGHSRGAEAVVRCVSEVAGGIPSFDVADFINNGTDNRTGDLWKHLPDTLNNINAVISLAPTDASRDQVEEITEDIPYFVLYGSMEGDVIGNPTGTTPNRTSGFSIYDRTNNSTEKGMAFVYGGTHNGFITTNFDFTNFANKYGATGTTIPTSIQKNITLAYMNAFMRIHMKSENVWRPYLYGDLTPTSIAYNRVYLQFKQMEATPPPSIKWINPFQGGAGTVTLSGSAPSAGSDLEYGELIDLDERTPHDTQGIRVEWTAGTAAPLLLEVDAAGRDISMYDYLSFRIGMAYDSALTYADLSTLIVELQYVGMPGAGNYSRILNREVPAPDLRRDPSFGGITATLTKTAMMTIRIPLSEFQSNGVDLTRITNILLTFPSTLSNDGSVLIDDVEFTD